MTGTDWADAIVAGESPLEHADKAWREPGPPVERDWLWFKTPPKAPPNGSAQPIIEATPFQWIEPRRIPPRRFIYGHHYVRQFLSTTVAPGGIGKTSLGIVEGLAMTSGKPLLGLRPKGRLRVWYWNGEDPHEELERRFMATAMHYGLTREHLAGYLFVNSGRWMPIVIAQQTRDGATIAVPVVEAVTRTILENGIDTVIIDPFVASHRVTENDNNAIELVAKAWAGIADETNSAIDLVHHIRKIGGGAEATVEDGRGASALLAAARSARVLNVMKSEEAERAGVERPRSYFRVENGKANLAAPIEKADWFKFVSVKLENARPDGEPDQKEDDDVGVVTAWAFPDAFDGVAVADLRAAQQAVSEGGPWRENNQANDWVGRPIARVLKLDPDNKQAKRKITAMLKVWIDNGMFVRVERKDPKKREMKTFVEVGQRANN
jgi:hypothetical protein